MYLELIGNLLIEACIITAILFIMCVIISYLYVLRKKRHNKITGVCCTND